MQRFFNILYFFYKLVHAKHRDIRHISNLHEMYLKVDKNVKYLENLTKIQYEDLRLTNGNKQKECCRNREFSLYSQNGEDGIILYLFSKLGVKTHKFVEFGAGGKTSNTENLIKNYGWSGLLIDGNKKEILKVQRKYNNIPEVGPGKVKAVASWITAENINSLIKENSIEGEIDLLSIDVDGNDYWIWKAINAIQPRLVVVEYNASFGKNESITIKYNPAHAKYNYHRQGWYHGASLKALEKLGKNKGYELVCCDSNGVNAFFVRHDLKVDYFESLTAEEAFYPHFQRINKVSQAAQFEQIRNFPLETV